MKEKFFPAVRAQTAERGEIKEETFLNVSNNSQLASKLSQFHDLGQSKSQRNSSGINTLHGYCQSSLQGKFFSSFPPDLPSAQCIRVGMGRGMGLMRREMREIGLGGKGEEKTGARIQHITDIVQLPSCLRHLNHVPNKPIKMRVKPSQSLHQNPVACLMLLPSWRTLDINNLTKKCKWILTWQQPTRMEKSVD